MNVATNNNLINALQSISLLSANERALLFNIAQANATKNVTNNVSAKLTKKELNKIEVDNYYNQLVAAHQTQVKQTKLKYKHLKKS